MPIPSDILKRLNENDPTLIALDLSFDQTKMDPDPLDLEAQPEENFLDEEDGKKLAKALQGNTHLTYLDLSGNGLSESIFEILKVLENNQSLKALNIYGYGQIDPLQMPKFLRAIRKTNVIWVDASFERPPISDVVKTISASHTLPDKRSIRVGVTNSQMQSLKGLVDELLQDELITNLSLVGYSFLCTVENCEEIARLIKNHQTLQSLGLHNGTSKNIGLAILIEALKENKNITTLDLSLNNITDVGIDNLIVLFTINQTITALNLAGNQASDNTFARLIDTLATSNIKELDLSRCQHLSKNSTVVLAGLLRTNKTLEKLILQSNHFTEESFQLLIDALKENHTLQEIDLMDIKINFLEISQLNLQLLHNAIKCNTSLIRIEFSKYYRPIISITERNTLFLQDAASIVTCPPYTLEEKIAILEKVDLPVASYLLGAIYNTPHLDIYDPNKAFECFQNAEDYLPAQKALLSFLIANCIDEGNLVDPIVFTAARQTAADILAKDPNDQEAKTFLDAPKTYGKSLKMVEEFQNTLFKRKNSRNEQDAEDRAAAQLAFDKNWGITIRR